MNLKVPPGVRYYIEPGLGRLFPTAPLPIRMTHRQLVELYGVTPAECYWHDGSNRLSRAVYDAQRDLRSRLIVLSPRLDGIYTKPEATP